MTFFKYPVRINLGVTTYGSSGDFHTQKVLVDQGRPPHIYLTGAKDVLICVEKLFSEYFDYDIDWTHLKFVCAKTVKEDNQLPQLHLNYICLANSVFDPKMGEWSTFVDVYKNENGEYEYYEEIITQVGDVVF